jgi:hypothetical protein
MANDRALIASLYLQGKFQSEIGQVLGVSRQQISYDLKAIHATWRSLPDAELNELRAKELARIDVLEREYWQAWEHSKRPKEITNTEKEGDRIKVGKRSEQRSGNPAFLSGVMNCITLRSKILGLEPPVRTEVTGADGAPLYVVALPPQSVTVDSWLESIN